MDPSRFDHLTRQLARTTRARRGASRRTLLGAAVAALAVPLWPRSQATVRAQGGGLVPVGDTCAVTADCQQADMQRGAICADNGFRSDSATNCCLERGCCQSDADCCGDRRCAVTSDVCHVCMQPPFPTRVLRQFCRADADCVPAPSVTIACVSGRCACVGPANLCVDPGPPLLDVPLPESAMEAANQFSYFEVTGQLDHLYQAMHPDAQSIIPRATIVGWFSDNVPIGSALPATARKVRFIDWTWPVTGVTYPNTAEIAFDQVGADDRTVRDVVRLAQDQQGSWHWFFGRDRAFVEAQIARYGN